MGLFEHLKTNSSTFHLRTKEEIDVLFAEMEDMSQTVDSQLDFLIRMSIQKVKLQLYYVLKLEEYRRKPISVTTKASDKNANNVSSSEPTKKKAKNKVKKKRYKETSIELQHEIEKGQTKEQLIAANKAKIARFHPEPDLSTISPKIAKERQKIKHEKEMLEKTKNQWTSIVSIPMGGMNK
jgi:hypothetical protein